MITPKDIVQIKSIHGFTSWSPDSEKIVFSTNLDGFHYNIWMADFYGNELRKVTNTDDDKYYPTFSPNGQWLAYISKGNIFVISIVTNKVCKIFFCF